MAIMADLEHPMLTCTQSGGHLKTKDDQRLKVFEHLSERQPLFTEYGKV
jgi:hypothetical protein